jgi:tripartite-type tricarboxylate transporter receptor subunit TctC
MQKRSLIFLVTCLSVLSILLGGCTSMENKTVTTTNKYPEKPITLIVPFGVGGGTDLVARLLEKSAPTHLGQPLVIVNKPGGAGTLGWNEVSGATPDGYTLGMTAIEILLQPLYGPTKYHYPTALEPIVQISESLMVMAVQAEQPWENTDNLIAYAKQHPGKIKFGHGGIGGIAHLAGETFAKSANIHLEQVPYQSAAEAMASLLGGHTQVAFVTPASVKEYMKNGTIRVLALASEKRLTDPTFANVPTFKEQGLDVIGSSWFGIAAPKELPIDVKNKLTNGFKAMINDPEFKKNIEQLGLQVNYLGPKESEEKWLTDSQRLTQTAQETGIVDKIKAQKK